MCKNIGAQVALLALHELHVGLHAFLGVGLGELVADVGI